jgi:hypothetical protein
VHPVLALFRRNAWATEQLLKFCDGRPEVAAPAEPDVYGALIFGCTGDVLRKTSDQ